MEMGTGLHDGSAHDHAVFQATVAAKMRVCKCSDRGRSEAFLRRSAMFGYRDTTAPSLACICAQANDKLLKNTMNMLCNARHLLHIFLPERSHHYSFRDCPHNRRLPNHTSALNNNDINLSAMQWQWLVMHEPVQLSIMTSSCIMLLS